MPYQLIEHLPKVRGKYIQNAALSHRVWFRVGGPAEIIFKPADVEDLSFFLRHKPWDVPVTTIGVGSNLLIRDGGITGVVVRLGRGFNNIFFSGNYIDVGAGLLDQSVAMLACQESLSGFEFLAGIPGMIGGALRLNAGCYGRDISNILVAAFALDPQGKLHTLTPSELNYSYRHCSLPEDWIFIGARFKGESGHHATISSYMDELLKARESSQPVRSRTGGSTFTNPENHSAWRLIDQAGCRGLKKGGAEMSALHCNFMINTGQATAYDLEELGEEVRRKVLENSGIALHWEIHRIGSTALHQIDNYNAA